ncbi:hypothetical protein HNP37_004423 [Flavobacterium nitrogenifigens]|uniref:Uncharacterized protein n=2 Tax=Flavobacterium TaxID=237 RepID=A0A7W7J149_9FLAO|nr:MULTISPECIES: hypothetical protein [Flavobacterium]MBB4804336.1 hypothetical protein [Flavobacterium nitrogenifigens]MBB6389268.1 hypothetical protein [Flavobacterium notoginsengisoli]
MIERREKRKKIFYVPGMISLVLIPLFCLFYFYQSGAFKVYGSLDYSVPYKEDFEKHKVGELRKYKSFYFNDQKSKEEQNLRELRFFTRDLVKRYDSVNGAKIYFGPKMDYDTFVSVLDIMTEENMPFWAQFSNELYAFAFAKPDPNKKRPFVCGTSAATLRYTRLMEEENRKKELRIFQKAFLKQQWLVFLGYFGIVLISIFALVKFNKNKKYNQK